MRIAAAVLVFSIVVSAQTKPAPETSTGHLPVKRVVLYKNGVGYFEHVGRVSGNQEFSVDFTTAQLNDVLKSLTVLDLGEGKISAIRYNSVAPISQRLSGLRLALGENTTRADFLNALRGTRLELRSGTSTTTGKLLSVERVHRINTKGDSTEITELTLVTDAGEMRSFELSPATSVRIVDRELSQDVNRYLNTIGSNRGTDVRRMYISTVGSGEREVLVSYISEVPVWKSTYRVILPDKPGNKPLLQGWAIVDNTVGEDWNGVQLSLVAGAPQSFIQEISQPYYVKRPVISLPDSVSATPQSHEASMMPTAPVINASGTALQGTVKDPSGAVVAGATVTLRNESNGTSQSTVTDSNGFYVFHNASGGNIALFVDARGFKRITMSNIYLGTGRVNEIHPTLQVASTSEVVEVTATAPTINTMSSSLASVSPEAEGSAVGDLFSYDLKQKITIAKDQSALVPILQARVDAEKVTVWNESSAVPLRALWLKNTSTQTLDGGTFNVIDADTFAGEGILDPIHAGERRLISYALDSAVHVKREGANKSDDDEEEDSDIEIKTLRLVRISKGTMVVTSEQHRRSVYVIHNADSTPREVVVESKTGENWKLAKALTPEETTASLYRFRVKVDAGGTSKLEVNEFRPDQTEYALTNIDQDKFILFTNSKLLTPNIEAFLRDALKVKEEIYSVDLQIRARESETQKIGVDQNRLRENMKALKGSPEERALLQRYTRQLDSQEDRLAVLQHELEELHTKRDKLKSQLDQQLNAITYEPVAAAS